MGGYQAKTKKQDQQKTLTMNDLLFDKPCVHAIACMLDALFCV